jgi:hypothetical protein
MADLLVGVRLLDPERPRQLPLVGGPVDGIGGQAVAVHIPPAQRHLPAVRALDMVGDDQVAACRAFRAVALTSSSTNADE